MPTPEIQDPYLIANASSVNVRTGPGLDYEKIGMLLPGAKASIVGYNSDWWVIEINDERGWVYAEIVTTYHTDNVNELEAPPLPTPEPTATPSVEETPVPVWAIDEDRWIDVDLSEQRLTAYEMQRPVKSYLVSTGLPQTPTPVGQYRIWIKFKTDDMAGADYYIKDVPWVMYFFEGYGLHGVTWHANFGTQMSHGCVNQPNDMAEWLFNFSDVGTLVNVHE
jgi:lipoprotein-anchoring transpeptidase ErfK/SrfK